MEQEPKTLQAATVYFNDLANCREYIMARRWPNGVTCPTCGSSKVTFSVKHNRWQCGSHHPKRQFTVKTGTIFEDSPLGLDKWLMAMWMIINCKNGVSSYEIAKDLGITQKSAWFILHRLREVMQDETGPKLSGEIEADETFVGGAVKNMHRRSKRSKEAKGSNNWGKSVVLGLLERDGRARAAVAPNRHKHVIHENLVANVEAGSKLRERAVCAGNHQPRPSLRTRPRSHERNRKFLVPTEAHPEGHVCQRRSRPPSGVLE
jgi:transposase-like protein